MKGAVCAGPGTGLQAYYLDLPTSAKTNLELLVQDQRAIQVGVRIQTDPASQTTLARVKTDFSLTLALRVEVEDTITTAAP